MIPCFPTKGLRWVTEDSLDDMYSPGLTMESLSRSAGLE